MSEAEIKVIIRYGQIIFSLILLAALFYLGLTCASHAIGFCMTVHHEECVGPFYHVRHALGAFLMAIVLMVLLIWPVGTLHERWKKDVEKAEAAIQEEKKRKAIEEFRKT